MPHASTSGAKKSVVGQTRDMWKNQDKTGAGEKSVALDSAHHNMVCALRLFNSQFGGSESVFTSSGLVNGRQQG